MTAEVSRIAPMRAGATFGLIYAFVTLPIVMLTAVVWMLSPTRDGDAQGVLLMVVLFPVLALVASAIVGALFASSYNLVARLTGGLRVEIRDQPQRPT